MEVGEPQRTIEIVPLREPVPVKVPDYVPGEWEVPLETPEPEKAPALVP